MTVYKIVCKKRKKPKSHKLSKIARYGYSQSVFSSFSLFKIFQQRTYFVKLAENPLIYWLINWYVSILVGDWPIEEKFPKYKFPKV